jgi:hypothetical protein
MGGSLVTLKRQVGIREHTPAICVIIAGRVNSISPEAWHRPNL